MVVGGAEEGALGEEVNPERAKEESVMRKWLLVVARRVVWEGRRWWGVSQIWMEPTALYVKAAHLYSPPANYTRAASSRHACCRTPGSVHRGAGGVACKR